MSDLPHIDPEHLDSLLDFLAPDKVRSLFNSALRGAPPLIEAMRAAISAGDGQGLYRAGHTAKGMFGNLGMRRCEDLSRRIETHGKAGEIAAAPPLVEALAAAVDETGARLIEWIDAKQKPG